MSKSTDLLGPGLIAVGGICALLFMSIVVFDFPAIPQPAPTPEAASEPAAEASPAAPAQSAAQSAAEPAAQPAAAGCRP